MNTNSVSGFLRSPHIPPAFFFCSLLAVYPGMTLLVPTWNFICFQTGTIVLVMIGLLFLHPVQMVSDWRRFSGFMRLIFLAFVCIACYHFFHHTDDYLIQEKGLIFLYSILPLSICVFAGSFEKWMTPSLTFLWLHDTLLGAVQYVGLHWFLFGLPQNINWNAAYLAVTSPFAILWCLRRNTWSKKFRYSAVFLIVFLTLLQIWITQSRGFLVAALVVVWLFFFKKASHIVRKRMLYITSVAFFLSGLLLFMIFPLDRISAYLAEDERIYLWKTTMNMIKERPFLGYSGPSFEAEYLPFRTAEFFDMVHSAVRVDHPHNHFLYITASFGILGLVVWLLLLANSFYEILRHYRNFSTEIKMTFFCFLYLLVHAQFDLVFYSWPTSLIGMLFLGLLWRKCEGIHPRFWRPHASIRKLNLRLRQLLSLNSEQPLSSLTRKTLKTLGIFLLISALIATAENLHAEILSRQAGIAAEKGDVQTAVRLHKKAAFIPASNLALRSRAFYYASTQDPASADDYVLLFQKSSTPHYGFIHDYAAFAYTLNGNYETATHHLLLSVSYRPYSVIPLLMLQDVYQFRNMQGAADAVKMRLQNVMDYRNLSEDDLKTVVKDQTLDLSTKFKRKSDYEKD